MRQMKDSTHWAAIPVGTPIVAGYVAPSHFAWPAAGWSRFPSSVLVRITPSAGTHGAGIHVLDVETGDATPAQVPGWVSASLGAGQPPTVYMNVATWPAVIRACTSAGVPIPEFWVANWNGIQNLPSITVDGITYTAVAHQYADPAHGSGGDWDSSIAADQWPGVDQGDDMTPEEHAWLEAVFGSLYVTASTPYGVTLFDSAKNNGDALTALSATVTTGEAALLSAVQGVVAGTVDAGALAQALVPLLAPADAHALLTEMKALLPAS